MTSMDKKRLAYHEAGHVIMYLKEGGCKFKHVTIEAGDGHEGGVFRGHVDAKDYEYSRISLLISFAGHCAEEVYLGSQFKISDSQHSADDVCHIHEILARFDDDTERQLFFNWLAYLTRKILGSSTGKKHLENISAALLEKHTLTYKEAKEIYDSIM